MSSAGRPRSIEPYVKWNIPIPASLAAQVEMLHFDPVMGKPKYGARNKIIVELLREYVARHNLATANAAADREVH